MKDSDFKDFLDGLPDAAGVQSTRIIPKDSGPGYSLEDTFSGDSPAPTTPKVDPALKDFFDSLPDAPPKPNEPETSWSDILKNIPGNIAAGTRIGEGKEKQALADYYKTMFKSEANPERGMLGSLWDKFRNATNISNIANPAEAEELAQSGAQDIREAKSQEEAPNAPSMSLKNLTSVVGQGAGEFVPAMAAGPMGLAAYLGMRTGAEEYSTQREAGKTPEEAVLPAVGVGALNTALGGLSLSHVLGLNNLGFLAKVGIGAGEQAALNNVLSIAQQGIEAKTLSPDMTFDEFMQQVKQRAPLDTATGALGGAAFGTVAHGMHKLGDAFTGKPTEAPTERVEPTVSGQAPGERIEPTFARPTPEEVITPQAEPPVNVREAAPKGATLYDFIDGKYSEAAPEIALTERPDSGSVTEAVRAHDTVEAIREGRTDTIDPTIAEDLVRNDFVRVDSQDGSIRLTEDGEKLSQELKDTLPKELEKATPEEEAMLAEYHMIKDQSNKSSVFNNEPKERVFPKTNYVTELSEHTPLLYRETSPRDAMHLLPHSNISTEVSDLHLADTPNMARGQHNNKGVLLAFDSQGLRGKINTQKPTMELNYKNGEAEYIGKHNKQSDYQDSLVGVKVQKNAAISNVEKASLNRILKRMEEAGWQKQDKGSYVEYVKPKDRNIVEQDRNEQYSATIKPTDRFNESKEKIREQIQEIAKKINPSVKVDFAEKLFGEGEALKKSGAETGERQEVAGSYDKMKNLIELSLNTNKFDPYDTAFHEGYHSAREMVASDDDAVLKKAFPGTDKLSQPEHEAVEFGRYMTEKNTAGFTPAVKRVFGKIKQFLRELGKTLKLGKFNSVEDIFTRVESGDVFRQHVETKTQEAIKNSDTNTLRDMLLRHEIGFVELQEAVNKISPELHSYVYEGKKITPVEKQALLDSVAHQSEGNALEAAIHRISNDKVPFDSKKADESMLRYLEFSMDKDTAKNFLQEKKERVLEMMTKLQKGNLRDVPNDMRSLLFDVQDTRMFQFAHKAIDPYTGGKAVSKTAMWLRNLFHSRNEIETYFNKMKDFISPRLNEAATVLHDLTPREKEETTRWLQDIHTAFEPSNDKVRDAVMTLARINKEVVEFAREKGLDINETAGYFPRWYKTDLIVANKARFIKDATEAYRQTAKDNAVKEGKPFQDSPEEYKEAAHKWYDAILREMQGVSDVEGFASQSARTVPMPNSLKGRVHSKAADEIMRHWLHQDPTAVIISHIQSAARKAVFHELFGDGKWQQYEKQMAAEGLPRQYIDEIRDAVAINTGIAWRRPGLKEQTILNTIRAITWYAFLPKAGLNAVQEVATTAVQSGNLMDLHRAYLDVGKQFMNAASKRAFNKEFSPEINHAIAIADAIGVAGDIHQQALMASRAEMSDAVSDKFSKMMQKFFNVTGMSPVTDWNNVAAMRSGDRMVYRLAEDILHNKNGYKSAEFLMNEMGIPKEKVSEFAEWVMENPMEAMTTDIAKNKDEMAKLWRQAIRRFVEDCVQAPTPATKAKYATSPWGSIFYSLSGFFSTAEKNIVERNYKRAKAAITNKDAEGNSLDLKIAERLRMAVPLALTATLLPLSGILLQQMKDKVFYNKYANPNYDNKKSSASKILDYFMQGIPSRYSSMYSSFKYNSQMGNPLKQGIGQLFQAISDYGSQKGDGKGQKRIIAKQVLTLGVLPLINYALTASPLSLPISYTLMQIANSPQARNAILDAAMGPQKKHR